MKFAASILFSIALASGLLFAPAPARAPLASPPLPAIEGVAAAQLPWRDQRELAVRVGGVPREAAYPQPPVLERTRNVGDRANFWIADEANDTYASVDATIRVVTPHSYFYVADGLQVDDSKLQQAANYFDQKIYEGNRRFFGAEPPAGIDGDPHVSIVNANIPGLGGYFTSVDEYSRAVHPYSNERKAIYINVQSAPPGSAGYFGVLAHEFEHMIQSNMNKYEQTWVKEGSAEVATEANNLGSSGASHFFEAKADTQLDAWTDSKGDVAPHYGAAYLFISYFLEHYGGYPVAADLLAGDSRGPDTFDQFLARHGYSLNFEDVFRDWIVANYLDGTPVQDPRYQYRKLSVHVQPTEQVSSSTLWQDRDVRQYGTDYVELGGGWSRARVRFQGDQTTRVIAATAHSGQTFWWSNRGDLIDTRLTRAFDLTGLSSALLKFSIWHDLEKEYDYGYVMASSDGGESWTPLQATNTTTANPNGNALGPAFTGRSGGGDTPEWVEESVDLSQYAGKSILVRFELVTDDAYNAPGFAVDDISLPELGYSDSTEADDGGWTAEGFVRTDGELPEHFSLQLIQFGDQITVQQVEVASDESADFTIDNADGRLQKATLVVTAFDRYTTEPAGYRYAVDMQ